MLHRSKTGFVMVSLLLLLFGLFQNFTVQNPSKGNVIFYYQTTYIPYWTETKKAFLPYVGYVNKAGQVIDRLFDSTVLMDLKVSTPTKSEWLNFLEKTFNSTPPQQIKQCNVTGDCGFNLKSKRIYEEVSQSFYVSSKRYNLKIESSSDVVSLKAGYFGIKIYNIKNEEIVDGFVDGLTYSPTLGMWYRYLPGTGDISTKSLSQFTIMVPDVVAKAEVFVGKFAPAIGASGTFKIYSLSMKEDNSSGMEMLAMSAPVSMQDNLSFKQDVFLQYKKVLIKVESRSNVNNLRVGYIGMRLFNDRGEPITGIVLPGMTYSSYLGMWYRYISSSGSLSIKDINQFTVAIPVAATTAKLYVAKWTPAIGAAGQFYLDSLSIKGIENSTSEELATTALAGNLSNGSSLQTDLDLEKISVLVSSSKELVYSQDMIRTGNLAIGDKLLVVFRFYDSSSSLVLSGVEIPGASYSSYFKGQYFYFFPSLSLSSVVKKILIPSAAVKGEVILRNYSQNSENEFLISNLKMINSAEPKNLLNANNWRTSGFTLFADGKSPVLGLNEAVKEVSAALGKPVSHGIILMIPWQNSIVQSQNSELARSFGKVGDKDLDLSKLEDQIAAVKWYVDEAINRWQNLSHDQKDYLLLKGFYWREEAGHYYRADLDSSQTAAEAQNLEILIREISIHIQSKGYSFNLSPYNAGFRQPSYQDRYLKYFNSVWLQPNAWPAPTNVGGSAWATEVAARSVCEPTTVEGILANGIPKCEINDVAQAAVNKGVSLNLEWRLSPGFAPGRVFDYMDRFSQYGFKGGNLMIYEDGGVVYESAYSRNKSYRDQYEQVYRFFRK